MRILIADNQKERGQLLARLLEAQSHEARLVENGGEVLSALTGAPFQLLIAERALPGMDDLTLCQTLRSQGRELPILLLSGPVTPGEKAAALDSGADDYLTRPWDETELLARVRALGRRSSLSGQEPEVLTYGDLRLDLFSRRLSRGEDSLRLGFKEFDVLRLLITTPDILSKQELLDRVWGGSSDAEGNNVEAYISFLRKKLFQLGSQVSIGTLRRAGYFLVLEEESS